MALSFVQLPNDGTGKKLASESWTQGSDEVHGQKLLICDAAGNVVGVTGGRFNVDTELPAAAALSGDAVADPSAPAVGSFPHFRGSTTWERARSATAYAGFGNFTPTGVLMNALAVLEGGTVLRMVASPSALGDNNSLANALGVGGYEYNGSTWDKRRNVWDSSVLASAARTASPSISDITNYNGDSVLLILNVTAASGTGGLTVKLQGKDQTGAGYWDVFSDATPILTTGLYVFEIGAGLAAAGAGVRASTGRLLARVVRPQVVHGDASSYTYSLRLVLLPS